MADNNINDEYDEYDEHNEQYIPAQPYRTRVSGGDKALIWGGVAAGIVGIAGYGIYELSAINGSCTTKGSSCNKAVSAYVTEFNSCWNQYMMYLNQYTAEDAKAGIGISSAQQDVLNEYLSCAGTAAAKIAAVSKSYSQNPLTIVSYFVGAAVLGSALVYWGVRGAAYYRKYLAGLSSPSGAASGAVDGSIQYSLDDGILNPNEASGLLNSAQIQSSASQGGIQNFYSTLSDDDIITADEAADASAAEQSIVEDDYDELVDLFE